MSQSLISVIVPVYNAEKTIEHTLQTISEQTYRNLQVIIIDDGSHDTSMDLCRMFEKKDTRFKLFCQENQGVSSARNKGLAYAIGDYVVFVDADDALPLNALERLIDKVEYGNTFLVCGSYMMIKTRNRIKKCVYNDAKVSCFDSQFPEELDKISTAPWGKLFITSIIKNNNIVFPTNIPYGEDAIFFYTYLMYAKGISTIHDITYQYSFLDPNSAGRKYYQDFYKYMKAICAIKCNLYKNFNIDLYYNEEYSFFCRCLNHYIVHESNKEFLLKMIEKSSEAFPLIVSDAYYGECVENRNWSNIIKAWKKKKFVYYLRERMKLAIKL